MTVNRNSVVILYQRALGETVLRNEIISGTRKKRKKVVSSQQITARRKKQQTRKTHDSIDKSLKRNPANKFCICIE